MVCHRRRIKRLAQGRHLLLQPICVDVQRGEYHRPLLGDCPSKAGAPAEVERHQRLIGPQRCADVLDGRRRRPGQARVLGKAALDLAPRFQPFLAQLGQLLLQRLDGVCIARLGRLRQEVVEQAGLRQRLLVQVLLLAHDLGKRRRARGGARGRGGERVLHRPAPDGFREAQRLFGASGRDPSGRAGRCRFRARSAGRDPPKGRPWHPRRPPRWLRPAGWGSPRRTPWRLPHRAWQKRGRSPEWRGSSPYRNGFRL